jgi:hypothetical protein
MLPKITWWLFHLLMRYEDAYFFNLKISVLKKEEKKNNIFNNKQNVLFLMVGNVVQYRS